MRFCRYVLLLMVLLPGPAAAQSCPPERTALVLSGGGAKGLAHVGVLRALDSLGIRPDIIVGTSMGAIIGGLYASGYSAQEIDSLARNLPLSELFRTYQPRVPLTLGLVQPIVVWEQETSGLILQRSAVQEPEVNALISAGFLRGNLLARGQFDSLPIPFRAVATDLLTGSPVVLSGGDLARAVRASAAIPVVFEPERIDGRFLGDGGLSANVPIRVAREAGAERIIVSYTTETVPDSLNFESTLVLIDHLIGNLFRQPPDSLGDEDLAIRPDVEGFRSLNFSAPAINVLIRRGLDAALSALAQAECIPRDTVPLRRGVPPVLRSLTFAGPAQGDSTVLARRLGVRLNERLDPRPLQHNILNLGSSGRYSSLWLLPRGTRDSISLEVTPILGPSRIMAVGAAFDNDLGGRVWLGQVNRRIGGGNLESALRTSLGELEQDLRATLLVRPPASDWFLPTLELRASRELVRRFRDGDERSPLKVHEATALLGASLNWAERWHATVGILGRMWDAPKATGQSSLGPHLTLLMAGEPSDPEPLVHASADINSTFRRLELEGIVAFHLGQLQVRPRARYAAGAGLPEQLKFAFGGVDGFPGLHISEIRGSRELLASLALLYPIKGPLLFRVEPFVGAAGGEEGLLPDSEARFGVRAGFNLPTTLGPIRVEYGVSENGRNGLLVRIGRWF